VDVVAASLVENESLTVVIVIAVDVVNAAVDTGSGSVADSGAGSVF